MRPIFLALLLSACGPIDPNGYCESDSDCDPDDHCIAERERDSHLTTLPPVETIDRCWPKSEVGDWCRDDSWCVDGAACLAGLCVNTCDPSNPCAAGSECRPACSPAPCDVADAAVWVCK